MAVSRARFGHDCGLVGEGGSIPFLADLEKGFPGTQFVATSTISQSLRRVLDRAGLGTDADIRPPSVAAWRGRRVFDSARQIEAVALSLGVSSLDQAARIIGWRWNGH